MSKYLDLTFFTFELYDSVVCHVSMGCILSQEAESHSQMPRKYLEPCWTKAVVAYKVFLILHTACNPQTKFLEAQAIPPLRLKIFAYLESLHLDI